MPDGLSNHNTRLAVLETKVNYIEDTVKETRDQLKITDSKLDGVVTHIAKQNGTLPRLESNMNTLLERINSTEKETVKMSIKTKITWGIICSVITGALMILLKIGLGV